MADHAASPDEVPTPHPNGSTPRVRRSALRRRLMWGALLTVAAVWAYGIWYSVNRPAPEPLDDAAHAAALAACTATLADLRAVPEPSGAVEPGVGRVPTENEVLHRMVADLRRIEPDDPEGAEAFGRWLDDWDALIAARADFVESATEHDGARLRIPVADNAPVSVRMDDYADMHDLGACSTQTLRAEVVEGNRAY